MKLDIRFICVGAVKSGSSWLGSLLKQHPEVCFSSRKEVAFFNKYNFDGTENKSYSYGLKYYEKFWPKNDLIKGEVSPQYLFDKFSASRIKKIFPQVEILIILRNPIEVVYSLFFYEKKFNRSIPSSLSLEDAIQSYDYLIKSAIFSHQISHYFELFGRDKVHVYFLEEALKDKRTFSKKLYSDIGLNNINYHPNYTSVNKSKKAKLNLIYIFLSLLSIFKNIIERSWMNVCFDKFKQSKFYIQLVYLRNKILDNNVEVIENPKMSYSDRKLLHSYLYRDIEKIEGLLGVDLSQWKISD